jgi:hypothetical protein
MVRTDILNRSQRLNLIILGHLEIYRWTRSSAGTCSMWSRHETTFLRSQSGSRRRNKALDYFSRGFFRQPGSCPALLAGCQIWDRIMRVCDPLETRGGCWDVTCPLINRPRFKRHKAHDRAGVGGPSPQCSGRPPLTPGPIAR